jgi:hypothetical protein
MVDSGAASEAAPATINSLYICAVGRMMPCWGAHPNVLPLLNSGGHFGHVCDATPYPDSFTWRRTAVRPRCLPLSAFP